MWVQPLIPPSDKQPLGVVVRSQNGNEILAPSISYIAWTLTQIWTRKWYLPFQGSWIFWAIAIWLDLPETVTHLSEYSYGHSVVNICLCMRISHRCLCVQTHFVPGGWGGLATLSWAFVMIWDSCF
jgi:hypothetical protein